jgi:hypothetical protein
MKPRRLIWASSALCLLIASCEKPKSTSAASSGNGKRDSLAAERAAIEDERMALERQRLEEERAALEEEKAALEAERDARLAQREEDADQRDLSLEERQRALADREIDLSEREGDLADREAGLSDRELELAGQEALDDWEPEPVEYYEEPVADYGTFYDDLQPYGSWFETPDYGYVYQPTIVVQDTSWRPYTRGRWACTNRGWAWVSDEPFGWACFHYGRWTLLAGRGWVWVPGDEWAPSWVCWREGDDCIGWAPLPPETLCYRMRGWSSSVEVDFGIGHGCFTFVHCKHMADPIWRHCLPIGQNHIFIKQTTNITNIHIDRDRVVCGGPRFEKLRALVGRPWPVYQLETDRFQGLRDLAHRNAQLRGNRLAVFAPSMNTRWNAELKPQRVAGKWDEVKVVRAENGIKPEWTERFRETRQKQKEQAVAWKRDHSAGEDMQKQLQANREKVAEAQKTYQAKQRELVEARREKVMEKRELQQASKGRTLPGLAAKPPVTPEKAAQGEAPAGKPSLGERQRELAERMRESRNRGQAEPQSETPQTTPDRASRPNHPPGAGVADNRRERQQSPQEQAVPRRERNDGAVAQDDSRRQQLEEARRQQQEQVRQRQEENRQRQEEARQTQERSRTEAEEGSRRQRMEEARREQQESAREKAEQARQQQDDRQRQMEENRQRQQDEARERQEQSRRQAEDNQRRQQQEEMQRQQQERARQQQEERARQQQEERARQQEQERARQEERMREQQERARQQEEQRARQQEEMQRRQEEARQQQEERARQQQEERARQQEQARQQQEERQRQQEEARRQQEESRRQQEESRRQQEERSRQEQDERNRKQQEESQRQRGGR